MECVVGTEAGGAILSHALTVKEGTVRTPDILQQCLSLLDTQFCMVPGYDILRQHDVVSRIPTDSIHPFGQRKTSLIDFTWLLYDQKMAVRHKVISNAISIL
jgi:hypothetical protein